MKAFEIIGVAFALAMDAFAVALAVGAALGRPRSRHYFRLGWHFGLFQFVMPIIGWSAGRYMAEAISAWDHWAAFALLAVVGGKMIWEAARWRRVRRAGDPTRGLSLVALSTATSIDALAVGLSFALLGVSIWVPAIVIGIVAGAMTVLGLALGARAGRLFGRGAEAAGGCALVAIGIKVVIEHVAA
jgi:putative Mn2+ efflux pump MntP